MKRLPGVALVAVALSAGAPFARAADELRVVQSGPEGELASLQEAAEIRVVFSEPMVALGRIPDPVTAPFFQIEPSLPGRFRWSGTRTLIFTPEAPQALPYATRYRVTVDATATAVSGARPARAHSFSFTTPTVRLRSVDWYRVSGRHDQPVVIALRFNQPVSAASLGAHLALRFDPHPWQPPQLAPEAEARLSERDAAGLAAFAARVAAAEAAAASRGAVAWRAATGWDERRFPKDPDVLVVETSEPPPTNAHVRIVVGPGARGVQGPEVSGKAEDYVLRLEPTFFVTGLRCTEACDPDFWNPLRLSGRPSLAALRKAVSVARRTASGLEPLVPQPAPGGEEGEASPDWSAPDSERYALVTLEELGFRLEGGATYEVSVDATLASSDGQTLGHPWLAVLENWHRSAFAGFGDGHGVWEAGGGPVLPYYARNLGSVTEWATPVSLDELVPTLQKLQAAYFRLAPDGAGHERALLPRPDAVQSYGLDLTRLLSAQGTGLVWAALQEGAPMAKAHAGGGADKPKATLLQVTNLALSVKDAPRNTLVFVTRLDDGRPVAGAAVAIRGRDNAVVWQGATDADGLALAPALELRDPDNTWEWRFVVTAEKDGDVAYVGSDWNEGVEPWYFGAWYDLGEAKPLLRGSVFADRGVYRLGEEVHFKALVRSDTADGMQLLPAGTRLKVTLRDTQGEDVDARELALSEWGSADWTVPLPQNGPLGGYAVEAEVAGQQRSVFGGFLVAAYRRPDFRVDANLAGASSLAGAPLTGLVEARYLFGAPMRERPVRWRFSRTPLTDVPGAVAERFDTDRWAFLDQDWDRPRPWLAPEELQAKEASLDAEGRLRLELASDTAAGLPFQYTLEGEVTDVSRQTLAGRASFRVDPAPVYLGLRRPAFFTEQQDGLATEVIAVEPAGRPVAGVTIELRLSQIQWHSVRRAEGGGFYTWETERREVEVGRFTLTSAEQPVAFQAPLATGGYFVLEARAGDAEGRTTTTRTGFYVLGEGYTAWARYDHNRLDLVPEKKTWAPGETARILVKSPWEQATALLTTEREGVRSRRVFELGSTQATLEVPVGEADVPNVFVSLLLVKGRTGSYAGDDTSDPGKPSFRLGYVELTVEDTSKRLDVKLSADREEYRPGARARVTVEVRPRRGEPQPAEVTLWAVDYGVLSLTGYRTPDVLGSVWARKALQVMNQDSRQRIVSRRALVPKGGEEGGGGGAEGGPGSDVRRDFRVLAFWLGSLVTDGAGRASAEVTLPEDLTTYRIMAVASDRESRFGHGEREIRTSKPVLLKAAWPRFLARGDTALFGSVVTNQLAEGGTALVTMESLDPDVLELTGETRQSVVIGPRASAEVRFDVRGQRTGTARVRTRVSLLGETDAFEETLSVRVLTPLETLAAYGLARPSAQESLELPAGVVPGVGGLDLELSSTALVGLGEGARFLVDYPYGCAEQRASAALALVLAADLGDAFRLPGIEPAALAAKADEALAELPAFQCQDGGFAYWKDGCPWSSPYLTSYVSHVLQRAGELGHAVAPDVLARAYAYLEQALAQPPPDNEGWWPAYTAWQAFAVRALARGGRAVDSHLTRLFGHLDRMPVFALAYLRDALSAQGETGKRAGELERRIRNAVLPEGGTSHVDELADPYLLWFWNSNVRSTALALGTLVRAGAAEQELAGFVRWLVQARRKGRWGNTQENATAMEALVDYYRKFESELPDFTAVVRLGGDELARQAFAGRSTTPALAALPMAALASRGAAGAVLPLVFERQGTGTLHYVARLRYALEPEGLAARDLGIAVERRYAPAAAEPGGASLRSFKAGELVRVTLTLTLTKERRFVAVSDPLPAGLEPVESWFATTASDLAREQRDEESQGGDWRAFWQRGGFDHVERHDDRVLLFATRLAPGTHVFSYVARATTAGSFRVAPAHAEEMYAPEVFGRTASEVVEVRP